MTHLAQLAQETPGLSGSNVEHLILFFAGLLLLMATVVFVGRWFRRRRERTPARQEKPHRTGRR